MPLAYLLLLYVPPLRRRLAIITAMRTFEAAEQKRDDESTLNQSLRLFNQDVHSPIAVL